MIFCAHPALRLADSPSSHPPSVRVEDRSGITNDPNRPDDPQYIVRLVKKIVTVSLGTMKVVDGLPKMEVE